MKLRKWEIALFIALVVAVFCGATLENESTDLSNKMIRLHVVANSDSEEDQSLKLKVRDSVLKEVDRITEGMTDRNSAEEAIKENLSSIVIAASNEIYSHGYTYGVTAQIKQEIFPTREYDTFSLPAGEYTSLRVVIGNGEGHNWWCVVFPPVCASAAIEMDSETLNLTDREVALITESSPEYIVKFKAIEILGSIKNFFESCNQN